METGCCAAHGVRRPGDREGAGRTGPNRCANRAEILVAPSTDPSWTPLFLTAGGLVMEMGGSMSHGAVVAREYGIPAVVGVASATERIKTGDQVAVDSVAGLVRVVPPNAGAEHNS